MLLESIIAIAGTFCVNKYNKYYERKMHELKSSNFQDTSVDLLVKLIEIADTSNNKFEKEKARNAILHIKKNGTRADRRKLEEAYMIYSNQKTMKELPEYKGDWKADCGL